MSKLLPFSNSAIIKSQKSGIVKSSKFFSVKSKTISIGNNSKESPKLLGSTLSTIEKKVVQIDKLLKDSFLLSKKEDQMSRKDKEKQKFEGKEKELEGKKPSQIKGIKLPSLPKMGILDWIKNFITQTILGFFAVRLIEFLPQLLKILPVIIKVGDFFIDVGGKMLDGLITFVDWGYKAIDATRGFVKNLGGERLAQNFDKFAGAIDNIIEIAIITALATADSGGEGGSPGRGVGGRGIDTTGRRVGVDAQNRYAQRFGRDQFAKRFGKQNLSNLGGKIGTKTVLKFVKPLVSRIPIIGGLIEFGLSWALGEPLGKAAFRGIGSVLIGAIGTVIGGPIGAFLGSWAGGEAGGLLYDMFFGNKKVTPKGKTVKAAGGGITKGRKSTGSSPKRNIKKKKKARTISFTPRKIKPGANTGGEDKVQKLFPNPEKPSGLSGFLGGLFGGNQQQQEKPKEKSANPQEFLIKSNDVLGRTDFFGPFFTLAIKTVLGQKPDALDYKNAGRGLNTWMQTTFKSGSMGFAGGGEVDIKQFFAGEDYTDIIARSVEDSVSKEVDMTIRDLAKELSLRPVGKEEMREENIRRGQEGGEGEAGPAGSSGDKLTMARNLMRDLGLTASQAAGIVGNMAAESGVENARPQGSRPGTKAPLKVDGKTGYGLVQWTSKGRQQALADFARSRGADLSKPLSMDIEYQFFLKEFRGAYGNVLSQIKNAPDVKTASTIFMQQYEIPAGYKTEAKIMERYNMSKPVYDRLAKGEGKATEGKGTYIDSPTNIGSSNVIQYVTGDVNYKGDGKQFYYDRAGHGLPGNYHDHIAFATIAEKENAKRALRAANIKIGSEYRSGDPGYHGKNLAIDVPGGQWGGTVYDPIDSRHFAGSKRVRQILGIGQNAPRFHGGPILKTGYFFGHKGEYVIDKDSLDLVGEDLIATINSIENQSQLIQKAPSIIEKLKSISNYTDYENQESKIVYIEVPSVDSGGGSTGMSKPSLSYDYSTIDTMGEQMSDSLMYG